MRQIDVARARGLTDGRARGSRSASDERVRRSAGDRQAFSTAARLGRPVLVSRTRCLQATDAIAWFAHAPNRLKAVWLRPASGVALAIRGTVCDFHTQTRDLGQIAAAWREVADPALVEDELRSSASSSDALPRGPLLLGGVGFDPLRPASSLWSGFPSARFVLPEQCLIQDGESARLTSNELIGAPGFRRLWEIHDFRAPRLGERAAEVDPQPEMPPLSADAWRSLVRSTVDGIRSGELGLQKVVLARARHIVADEPFDIERSVRALADAYPTCTIFAFGDGERTFVGATPERLVTLHKGVASSMALAGTIRRGESDAEDAALGQQLLADPKERGEHAIVVDSLRESLAGVCTSVVADAEPRIERLSNVQHLLTSVRGQVRPETNALDLVQAVHPTPAMGGSPRAAALDYIRQFEQLDRGWYTGAFGWLDSRGEGDFVVAIRSALVRGARATLFAGCGIVADSEPAREFAESELKLRPMLSALGVAAA
jgi:isochorismate synthase